MLKEEKNKIITEHAMHKNDRGSSEVQIAVFTSKISELTAHLKIHKKDFHSRRGLLAMVNKRKSLLGYLKGVDQDRYKSILEKLNLRH